MRIVGIDPGLSGGAFIYDTETFNFGVHCFKGKDGKIDTIAFFEWLYMKKPDLVFIEQIFLTGREGAKSATTIGSNYGRILASLEISFIRYVEVPPKTWQRALGLKTGSREIVKQSAKDLAVKRFTLLPFLKSKSKKLHDGLTDAACITLYGELICEQKNKLTKSTHKSVLNTEISAKSSSTSKDKKTKPSTSSKSKKSKSSQSVSSSEVSTKKAKSRSKSVGKN